MVRAGELVEFELPAELTVDAEGECWLTVRAELAEATAWAPAGHVVARTQRALTAQAATAGMDRRQRNRPVTATQFTVGPASFDPSTGGLRELLGLPVSGPTLELWRAPTDNDRSSERGSFELGTPEATGGEGTPGPSSEERWRARGLDRLVSRVLDVTTGPGSCTTLTGSAQPTAHCSWTSPTGGGASEPTQSACGWKCRPPPAGTAPGREVGIHLQIPADLEHAEWFGTGPQESYPDSRRAARVGQFRRTVDELNVPLLPAAGDRTSLRPAPAGPERPVRTGAEHPHRARIGRSPTGLHPDPAHTASTRPQPATRTNSTTDDVLHLYLDDAVHGLGSRACGIDVLPEHALWPTARAFGLIFEPPRERQ